MHTDCDSQRGKPSTFFNNDINKEWYDGYLEDCNERLLDKNGLANAISHDVNDYTVKVINHLLFGIRAHFVRLIKDVFIHYDDVICEIAALRMLKQQTGDNRDNFTFELSAKDNFRAEIERKPEK